MQVCDASKRCSSWSENSAEHVQWRDAANAAGEDLCEQQLHAILLVPNLSVLANGEVDLVSAAEELQRFRLAIRIA